MGIARPTVSVHAKVLREAGLIDSRQEGRVTRHEIVPEAVRKLMRELQSFLDIADEPQPNERREVDHANDDTR